MLPILGYTFLILPISYQQVSGFQIPGGSLCYFSNLELLLLLTPGFKENMTSQHLYFPPLLCSLPGKSKASKFLTSYPFLTVVFPLYLQYPSGFFLRSQRDLLPIAAIKLPLQLLADTSISDVLLTWCIISICCRPFAVLKAFMYYGGRTRMALHTP